MSKHSRPRRSSTRRRRCPEASAEHAAPHRGNHARDQGAARHREGRHPASRARRRRQAGLGPARRRGTARDFLGDVQSRPGARRDGRVPDQGFRQPPVGLGRRHRLLRADPSSLLLQFLPQRQGRRPDGRAARPGRPHHVGQARQRERAGARQLSQERIPADRLGRPLEDQDRPCGPRAHRAAPGLRARSHHPHAAHGAGAARHSGKDRIDPARRVHDQPRAHHQARQPRADGGDLQHRSTARPKAASSRCWRRRTRIRPTASAR